jgi:hypothetical protein
MKYVVDIDGTICSLVDSKHLDYSQAIPYRDRIKTMNNLYDSGNEIVYFTARGMGRSGGNNAKAYELFYALTKKQLAEWGAKHHELILGKPAADIYIDDKCTNALDFFENKEF